MTADVQKEQNPSHESNTATGWSRFAARSFERVHPTDRYARMVQAVLARLGLRHLRNMPVDAESHQTAERLIAWLAQHNSPGQVQSAHPHISSEEMLLDCAACHSTKDKHFGY